MARERSWKGSNVGRCSTCRAPIVWAETSRGRRMPIDAVPVDDGDFVFVDGKVQKVPPFTTIDGDVDRFTSHFVTCPDADLHRLPRDRTEGGNQ